MPFKKSVLIWKDQRQFLWAKNKKTNRTIKENALNSEGSLTYNQERSSNYLFHLFLTEAISQMFNHEQLYDHWMHLLDTRICRYTYITPTVIVYGQNRYVNEVVQF